MHGGERFPVAEKALLEPRDGVEAEDDVEALHGPGRRTDVVHPAEGVRRGVWLRGRDEARRDVPHVNEGWGEADERREFLFQRRRRLAWGGAGEHAVKVRRSGEVIQAVVHGGRDQLGTGGVQQGGQPPHRVGDDGDSVPMPVGGNGDQLTAGGVLSVSADVARDRGGVPARPVQLSGVIGQRKRLNGEAHVSTTVATRTRPTSPITTSALETARSRTAIFHCCRAG